MNKLFIDMDNTIVDFRTPFLEDGGEEVLPHHYKGFFTKLEPFPHAIEIIKDVLSTKYDVWFVSKPSVSNVHSYSEKAEWIGRYFGKEYMKRLILMTNKSLLKASKDDFLIDDWHSNGQTEFEGNWIQYVNEDMPWNKHEEWLIKPDKPKCICSQF